MFASVVTWSVDPPITTDDDRVDLLRRLLAFSLERDRAAGVVDIIISEFETDLIMVFSLFDTLAEAFNAGESDLVGSSAHFADRLVVISRVVGQAYDGPGYALIDRDDAHRWRDTAAGMFSTMATWRIDGSLRAPAALNSYLAERMEMSIDLLKHLGLVDMTVMRLADDVIMAVLLYDRPGDVSEAHTRAQTSMQAVLGDKVKLVKAHTGWAFDVPQLIDNPKR